MRNFIYVFSIDGRDKLLAMHYELLKSDDIKHIFVFLNKEQQNFSCDGVPYAMSDILTF